MSRGRQTFSKTEVTTLFSIFQVTLLMMTLDAECYFLENDTNNVICLEILKK